MTFGYDLERLVVALEAVDVAAGMLFRHELTEWLAYRLLHIRADVRSLKAIIDEHNQKRIKRHGEQTDKRSAEA